MPDSNQITPEMLKMQRIELFKNEIKKMIATTGEALVKSRNRQSTKRGYQVDYSKEKIHQVLTEGTALERAKMSEYFFSVSGVYKRIILHYATFLTYSWLMVPHARKMGDKLGDKKNQKVYRDAADFCTNFGIERKCAHFAKEVLVKGAYFGLIHDTGENVAIQTLPFEFCRSRFKNHQDIDIIEFDTRFFDTIRDEQLRLQILQCYPKIIQKAYRKFKKGGEPWVFLPAEMGIYFCLFEEKPFFLDLIPLVDDLEDYKQIDKERNLLSLKRIITQEVPHDGLNLVFEPEEAAEMHEGVLEMLANNPDTDVITSYAKINLLDLSGDSDDKTEVQDAAQLIYDSAGVSKELFSATTDAGLKLSLNNDLAMMMVLGQSFAHFFTALLNNKFGNRKLSLSLLILPVCYNNADEYVSRAKDLGAFGYSYLTPITATGITQTNLCDLKELENDVLKLDIYLKPLQSAYTQSGKTNAITAKASEDASKTTATANNPKAEEKSEKADKKESAPAEKKGDGGENK